MQNPPPVQTNQSSTGLQTTRSSTGLDENIAAPLAYVFTLVSGLVFFLIEKDSRLVRFHAMQSILLSAAAFVLAIVLVVIWAIVTIVLAMISEALGALVGFLLGLVMFAFGIGVGIAFILCAVKAYQKQFFKLPVIGNMAEKFSAK
jgi:uncharacterized membrane protein